MRKLNLFMLLACLFSSPPLDVSAQTGTVRGIVFDDELAEVLSGASVFIVGTQVGRSTDIDGAYSFTLSPGTYTLQASFIGYRSVQTVVVVRNGQTVDQNFSLPVDLVRVDELVVVGTRRSGRTVIESPVPIDVLTPEDLQATGATEITQILAALIPSYNAPEASITDGSDHVRPATLRGQGPDQVLVLVNGKRRHTSALVHVNGSVGRGSTGVDMNAIPAAMIERVEVLRDGAAAQYGSDAIAGVINIVLKERNGLDAQVSIGQHFSIVDRGYGELEGLLSDHSDSSSYSWDGNGSIGPKDAVTYSDGKTANINVGYGLDVGAGNLFVGASIRHRDYINRAGLDPRQQYYTGDPASKEESFNRLNHRYGNGEFDDLSLFLNASVPVSDGAKAYAFGGASSRDGLSGCFYRRSLDDRTNRSLYPDGFLPKINAQVLDLSGAVGVKGAVNGWTYDLSEIIGSNAFDFKIRDTHNASMDNSPSKMDSGRLGFSQATTNADLFRTVDVGTASPLTIGLGAEFRFENYRITPGDESSYLDGGVPVRDGPNSGASTAAGAQCFPGFQPATARDENRTNVGVYVDIENNLTSRLLVSAAARFENYSDFGATGTGKVAARLELTDEFAVRGAASTGFRAPSLAQAWFTSIATNFIGGVPFEVGTFPVSSDVARALGARDLDPERSVNLSAGITYSSSMITLSVDTYSITVKDRISFTENFTDDSVASFLITQGIEATGGRYFTNALDTRTRGVDVTGRYGRRVGNGRLRVTAAMTFSDTEVTNKNADGVIAAPQQLIDLSEPELVSAVRIGDFELAQPNNKQNLQVNYDYDRVRIMARVVRFGSVTAVDESGEIETQSFSAKALTDLEFGYIAKAGIHLAIGANNIFDVYPDKQLKVNSFNGIFPYNGFSPFGFSGRYVYVRASIALDKI